MHVSKCEYKNITIYDFGVKNSSQITCCLSIKISFLVTAPLNVTILSLSNNMKTILEWFIYFTK